MLLADLLRHMRACDEPKPPDNAVGWAGNRRISRAAYHACRRGDWLLWVAARVDVDRRLIVLAACGCAELSLCHVPDGEDSPRVAIDTARAWCRGEASIGDVRSAAYASYATYAAHAAAHAAASAAAYAAHAAAYAAHAANAAYAAAYAADAPRWWDGPTIARCAALVRRQIPWETIEPLLIRAADAAMGE